VIEHLKLSQRKCDTLQTNPQQSSVVLLVVIEAIGAVADEARNKLFGVAR
jgi:hypothetical protein